MCHSCGTEVTTSASERPAERVEAQLPTFASERPPAERVEANYQGPLSEVCGEDPQDTNQDFDECLPRAGSCRSLLKWQAEARRWLDECRSASVPPQPPLGDGDPSMFDVREVLGGSGKVSVECEKAGFKVRNMVDFVTHWSLT